MKTRYCIILGKNFEEVEAITLIDLLRRAGVIVDIYGIGSNNITGSHNITIAAEKIFSGKKDIDIDEYSGILLPGGPGTRDLINNLDLLLLIKEFNIKKKLIFAICAAPLILDKCGVLNGKKFTCYPGAVNEIKTGKYVNEKVVVDGNIVTSQGVGTALESALKLIEIIVSKNEAVIQSEKVVYKETT